MLPLEIFDHKHRWLRDPFIVDLHSDYRMAAKDWCKANVPKQSWEVNTFTEVYGDRWYFEHLEDSEKFIKEFKNDSTKH